MKIAGIMLVMAGFIALIYGGLTFTSQGRTAEGESRRLERRGPPIPLPPVVGLVAVAAGGTLLYMGMKRR